VVPYLLAGAAGGPQAPAPAAKKDRPRLSCLFVIALAGPGNLALTSRYHG
jgi:hypothetical protein